MTINYSVELKGTDKLRKKWRQAPARLAGPARRFFNRATRTIRAKAISNTPVDTGRLRSSYFVAIGPEKVPDSASVFNPVVYAGPLEHKQNATPRGVGRIPFFGPAIADSAGLIRRYRQDLVREFVKAMGRR